MLRNFFTMLLQNKIKREHELTQWSESMTLQKIIFKRELIHKPENDFNKTEGGTVSYGNMSC